MGEVLGSFLVKLDEKGRIILPSKTRAGLAGGVYLTIGQDLCLYAFSADQLDRYIRLSQGEETKTVVPSAFERLFKASVVTQTPDKQGRIIIAPALRRHAGLERELIVIGLGHRLEIWDVARWQAYQEANLGQFTQAGLAQ